MARYIDADKFITWIDTGHLRPADEVCLSENNVVEMINLQPTADVAEVKHGEWAWIADDSPMCTYCGKVFDTTDNADAGITWNYCPNCGAKMDLRLCSDAECAPPCGDKSDCELYKNGYCGAKMDGGKAE